jgi:hypothetical protein
MGKNKNPPKPKTPNKLLDHNVTTSERLDMHQEIQTLASGLYSPLFATRNTIKEAVTYAYDIAKASDNPAAITTALHVVLNTIAQELERINTNTTEG